MSSTQSALSRTLLLPERPGDLAVGEAGQARLRFIGAGGILVIYLLAHWSGAFGDLRHALHGLILYTFFSIGWAWAVARSLWTEDARRIAVIVLDEGVFAACLWYSDGQYAPIVWMPIFMTVGNGLRYGTKLANFSAAIASVFVATAFVFSPFWRSIPGVAAGIVLGVFVVPVYAVALNLRLQRSQREAEQRATALEVANRTDPLTGVSNRLGFMRALRRLLEDSRDYGAHGAVFYIDLDGFKAVNDTAGHQAGDAVLVEVARLLREAVRSNDVVGRLGGDEFAIVARGLATAHDARGIACKAMAAVATIKIPGHEHLVVGATIGACLLPDKDLHDAESAIRQADELMLEAKRTTKGTFRIFGDQA